MAGAKRSTVAPDENDQAGGDQRTSGQDDESPEDRYHRQNPNIEASEYRAGKWYCGTKRALIEAGLAKACEFPGQPGCGITSTTFPASGNERKRRVSRRTPYLYYVTVYWTKEERDAWDARVEAGVRAEIDACEQAQMASAPNAYAARALEDGITLLIRAFNLADDPSARHQFDPEVTHRARQFCTALINLFHANELRKKPKRPSIGAQQDANFQRFMTRVTLDTGGATPS